MIVLLVCADADAQPMEPRARRHVAVCFDA
jgi:hypothetical protein